MNHLISMNLVEAQHKILDSLKSKNLCIIIGLCSVDYKGRATSTLQEGTRLVLIKADGSISVHENRLIRPTNYMVGGKIGCEFKNEKMLLSSKKVSPAEKIEIFFSEITAVESYAMEVSHDIRLTGSEKELNDALMEDLSFLEPGLKPINQQQHFRKGVCDIIAEDSKGRFVVIELKRRQADYNAVTQLKRYAEQVKGMKNVETRGILLAPSIRKSALELLKNYNLEFFSYDFEMGERSKIKGIEKKQAKLMDF
jgi:RecB family endonuclease NucS